MPKKANLLGTVSITISATPQVAEYLERLVRTGLYGKNTAEAAGRLVERGIEGLIEKYELTDQSLPRKK